MVSICDSMFEGEWLEGLEDIAPRVIKVIEQCPESFRAEFAEYVVGPVVRAGILGESGSTGAPPEKAGFSVPAGEGVGKSIGNLSKPFAEFMDKHKLAMDTVNKVVNLDDGKILVRNVGQTTAAAQRALAAIVALRTLHQEGRLFIDKEELRLECKSWGKYDGSNFTANMDNVDYQNTLVFVKEEGGWSIPKAAEGFIVEKIRNLVTEE